MYSGNLFVLDFVRRFFVSCAQIFEAYAVRTLIKFGCDWRKIGRKGKCMKDSESTSYKTGCRQVYFSGVTVDFYINDDTAWLRKAVGWVVNIVVAIACGWFLVYGFGEQILISGNSMQPQLSARDVVLMNRITYVTGDPGRFDVVVFEREDGKKNVKRIIGLPGETMQIKNGLVYINGEALKEDKMGEVSLAGRAAEPVRLGEKEYFLLGDNRSSSEDSRFPNIGNVKREQILGKVWFRMLPLLKLGFVS